jgi:hypothetical protein
MRIDNRANLDTERLSAIGTYPTLEKLIASGLAILDIRNADEFSLDAVVRVGDLYAAYQMT